MLLPVKSSTCGLHLVATLEFIFLLKPLKPLPFLVAVADKIVRKARKKLPGSQKKKKHLHIINTNLGVYDLMFGRIIVLGVCLSCEIWEEPDPENASGSYRFFHHDIWPKKYPKVFFQDGSSMIFIDMFP